MLQRKRNEACEYYTFAPYDLPDGASMAVECEERNFIDLLDRLDKCIDSFQAELSLRI